MKVGSLRQQGRPATVALMVAAGTLATPGTAPLAAQAGPSDADTLTYPVDPLSLPRPTLGAYRIPPPGAAERSGADAIRIDGRLDEASWARADSTTETWIQIQPEPGMPATEHTVVRVLYDDEALYIGATLYDSDPDGLITPGLEQDYDTHSSDIFGVALDTYHDKQNGFIFAINPEGAVFDAQTFNDQRDVVRAWEGIVEARTTVHDLGWTVEMAIPFSTLRFNPTGGEQVWGLNFSRRIRRKNEESNWAAVPLQFRLYRFSLAGTLEGLQDLPRSRNLWVKPYVLANRLSEAGDAATTGDVGLDVKWGLTPRMTLDLTANTDFSQVEVDREQVNLTRFSLFFPEKRDFFLENEGTFAFQDVSIRNYRTGSSPRNFKLFHSRRIGLSPDRQPLPILGGARLTGKVGERFEVGFLDMQTRAVGDPLDPDGGNAFAAENFAVARVKAHLAGGSSVGGIFVNRQETWVDDGPAAYNRAYGVDANFNVLGNMVLSGYAARTDELDAPGEDQRVGMVQAAWRDPIWNVSVLAKHVGDGFNPEVGFIDRRGVRRLYGTVGAHPKIRRMGVLELNPFVDMDVYTDLDGRMESREIVPTLGVTFMDGGSLTLEWADRYERLFTDTPIAGAVVPAGTYEWGRVAARYIVPGSHKVSGALTVWHGDFYDGRRTSVSANARFRPNAHLSMDIGVQHNALELGGRDFTADLYSARVRYARDVRTFLMGFVQYNESTDELISNVRFNLIHAPLSDLFLVLTERRRFSGDEGGPSFVERGITVKVTQLVAF